MNAHKASFKNQYIIKTRTHPYPLSPSFTILNNFLCPIYKKITSLITDIKKSFFLYLPIKNTAVLIKNTTYTQIIIINKHNQRQKHFK